ncbi:hypothetical protein EX30DRAFT_38834 [Ascodesmis nigricans]|uniref:RanBP2-type domain-containing protein n=1 Tax=Ascodesmis nigricans TaxID=341454 RepID=A0A4S2MLZ7_9PEZI|nr:hypothetical protein EX30DRAFT_38834 [Ascodesmis nigricans]
MSCQTTLQRLAFNPHRDIQYLHCCHCSTARLHTSLRCTNLFCDHPVKTFVRQDQGSPTSFPLAMALSQQDEVKMIECKKCRKRRFWRRRCWKCWCCEEINWDFSAKCWNCRYERNTEGNVVGWLQRKRQDRDGVWVEGD